MDLILKFLHIPSLCIDYNPIMDCNASDFFFQFHTFLLLYIQTNIRYIYMLLILILVHTVSVNIN